MTPSIGHNRVFFTQYLITIYIQDKSNISSTQFLAATSHQLSLIKMQNGEYFSLYFFLLWCFKHAGIGVDLRDCFAKRSTIRFLSHLHDKWYILTIIHYCFKHSFLDTVFSVTLIYFKNNLCQAIFILFKCFKHVYYFCISKDFLVISVYYKCFAGLFYRNDVLISIVTVPKTIHIVMGFFFLPLRYPAAFIMKRLSSSHRKCYQLWAMYIFQVCLH